MKCKTVMETRNSRTKQIRPAGSIIEHSEAYKLVRIGVATPADDECRERAGLSDEEIRQRQLSYADHYLGEYEIEIEEEDEEE